MMGINNALLWGQVADPHPKPTDGAEGTSPCRFAKRLEKAGKEGLSKLFAPVEALSPHAEVVAARPTALAGRRQPAVARLVRQAG